MSRNKIEPEPSGPDVKVDVIIEFMEWNSYPFDVHSYINKIAYSTLKYSGYFKYNQHVEFSVLLTDNKKLQQLNTDYRNISSPTNVLSFPYHDFSLKDYHTTLDNHFLGDIAISFHRISTEAIEQGKTFIDHFSHILVHGVLHLLGYDHQESSEAEEMENTETEILKILGINCPYVINV